MLYLFLTGNRSAYLNAIFTVLHFPKNTTYDLKYRMTDANSIVHQSAKGYINFNYTSGEETLILFNNEEGQYVPLRFGKLQKYAEEEGQIYYSVQLTEYCHMESGLAFRNFIDSVSPERVRHLTDNSSNKAEGILAFRDENNRPLPGNLKRSEDSWIRTVRLLGDLMKEMAIFKQHYLIFTKMEIKTDDDQLQYEEGRMNLISGKSYKLHMNYYIPEFNESPMESLSVKFYPSEENIGIINGKEFMLSQQNKIDIICLPRTNISKSKKVKIGFEIFDERASEVANVKDIRYVATPLELNLKPKMHPVLRNGMIILLIIISFIGACLSGVKCGEEIQNSEKILKVVGSSLTALSTFGMVYFMGKPKL